jgi:hypothetical protein
LSAPALGYCKERKKLITFFLLFIYSFTAPALGLLTGLNAMMGLANELNAPPCLGFRV